MKHTILKRTQCSLISLDITYHNSYRLIQHFTLRCFHREFLLNYSLKSNNNNTPVLTYVTQTPYRATFTPTCFGGIYTTIIRVGERERVHTESWDATDFDLWCIPGLLLLLTRHDSGDWIHHENRLQFNHLLYVLYLFNMHLQC
jgi:hypothetical protein